MQQNLRIIGSFLFALPLIAQEPTNEFEYSSELSRCEACLPCEKCSPSEPAPCPKPCEPVPCAPCPKPCEPAPCPTLCEPVAPQCPAIVDCCNPCDPFPAPTNPAYNAPARVMTQCPWDVTFDASFIYWVPYEENLEPAILSNGLVTSVSGGAAGNPITILDSRRVKRMDFDFQPGFQVALEMFFDYDQWDLQAEYTRFYGGHDKRDSARGHVFTQTMGTVGVGNTLLTFQDLFLPLQLGEGTATNYLARIRSSVGLGGLSTNNTNYTTTFHEKWHLGLDLADLDMGRWYYVGNRLAFHPFLGLRAAWMEQKLDVTYTAFSDTSTAGTITATGDGTVHSWGLGPRIGLNTNWKFCHGFRFFGDAEVDLLYTRYKYHRTDQMTLPSPTAGITTYDVSYHLKQDHIHSLRTHLDFMLGFGWGTCFGCQDRRIDFSAGYEFQVFFDQNMFRFFTDAYPESINGVFIEMAQSLTPNGNLYIHGLTLTAKIDF